MCTLKKTTSNTFVTLRWKSWCLDKINLTLHYIVLHSATLEHLNLSSWCPLFLCNGLMAVPPPPPQKNKCHHLFNLMNQLRSFASQSWFQSEKFNIQKVTVTLYTGRIPAQMFDWRVVLVPSAGRPTAVPLWVPALRAGMSQGEGGWWVVAMTPACHLTILFCQRLGHVSRVCTSLRPLSGSDYKWHQSTSFRCKARQEVGFSLTHSHLCTYRMLQMSRGKAVRSLSDWCPPPPLTGKGKQEQHLRSGHAETSESLAESTESC